MSLNLKKSRSAAIYPCHNSVYSYAAMSKLFSLVLMCLHTTVCFNCNFMQIRLLSCRGEKVGNQIGSNVIQFSELGMNR